MGSVVHYCRMCGKTKPDVSFRLGGTGRPRPDCLSCERMTRPGAHRARGSEKLALVPVKQYPDVPVHTGLGRGAQFIDGGPLYVAITDVCEFFGTDTQSQFRRLWNDPNYQPALEKGSDIATLRGAEMWFIRADKVSGWLHLINPNKVKPECRAGLIAYRDVCDRVLSDYMTGSKTAPPSPIVTPHTETAAIVQIREGLMTLLGPTVEQLFTSAFDRVITERLGAMPQQTAETWEVVRGATVIEREVTQTVEVEWLTNGWCYCAVNDNGLMAIGETGKPPEKRMEDSDYNGAKSGGTWRVVWSFKTDNRGQAEKDIIRLAMTAGACAVQTQTRGTFRYDERIVNDFKQLPSKMKYERLRRWIAQARLFEPPLFCV